MRLTRQIFTFILLLPFVSFGQKQGAIWYFGDHAGIDFNSGSPVTLNNGQTHFVACPLCHAEGTAVISDSSGSLLFYCNGEKIWNQNHLVMPHGDSLLSSNSSTQAALIVPQPGSSRYFYVFTTDDFYVDNLQYGFRYSVVDLCLDNGLGDVVQGQKNILLLDTVAEKVTAVKHSNGIDYWVITHKYYSDAFYAYHLTSSGISNTIISHIGSVHPTGIQSTGAAIGQLKASPNGLKLAIVNGNTGNGIAEYFDFDKSTGIVSNMTDIQWNLVNNFYGVSFSPDNSKLYIASSLNANGIYQFDLNAGGGDPDSVRASRTQIASYFNFMALQLAVDGKIYAARAPVNTRAHVGVINFPNVAGINCNYVDSAVDLNGHPCSFGFPNFIDSYDYSNTVNNCPTGLEEQNDDEQVWIFPNPFQSQLTISTGNTTISELTLYDTLMRKLLQQKFIYSATLNTSHLAEGIYIYEVRNNPDSRSRNFGTGRGGVTKKGIVVKLACR